MRFTRIKTQRAYARAQTNNATRALMSDICMCMCVCVCDSRIDVAMDPATTPNVCYTFFSDASIYTYEHTCYVLDIHSVIHTSPLEDWCV